MYIQALLLSSRNPSILRHDLWPLKVAKAYNPSISDLEYLNLGPGVPGALPLNNSEFSFLNNLTKCTINSAKLESSKSSTGLL